MCFHADSFELLWNLSDELKTIFYSKVCQGCCNLQRTSAMASWLSPPNLSRLKMKTNGVFGVRRVSSCTTKSQPTEKHPHSWCFCDSFCCDCVWNWDRSWLYCPSTLELGIEMMPLFLQHHSITRKKKNWAREIPVQCAYSENCYSKLACLKRHYMIYKNRLHLPNSHFTVIRNSQCKCYPLYNAAK